MCSISKMKHRDAGRGDREECFDLEISGDFSSIRRSRNGRWWSWREQTRSSLVTALVWVAPVVSTSVMWRISSPEFWMSLLDISRQEKEGQNRFSLITGYTWDLTRTEGKQTKQCRFQLSLFISSDLLPSLLCYNVISSSICTLLILHIHCTMYM